MPHYTKAPITEALIDLQVRLPEGFDLKQFQTVAEANRAGYSEVADLNKSRVEFGLEGNVPTAQHDVEQDGYVFKNPSENYVCQLGMDHFTFGRLAPYNRWQDFRDEGKRLWDQYRQVARPEAIKRVSVKYVNRIDIPLPSAELSDYFRIYPELPNDLPHGLVGFFQQTQIPHDDLSALLILTQALVPPPITGLKSIVLDIELVSTNNLTNDDNAVWALLERFHERKNLIFERCITNATRELIR